MKIDNKRINNPVLQRLCENNLKTDFPRAIARRLKAH